MNGRWAIYKSRVGEELERGNRLGLVYIWQSQRTCKIIKGGYNDTERENLFTKI
jgi:hypothetical protein